MEGFNVKTFAVHVITILAVMYAVYHIQTLRSVVVS